MKPSIKITGMLFVFIGLAFTDFAQSAPKKKVDHAKIYVSIVMHNEEPHLKSGGYPDFVKNPSDFKTYRNALLKLATMLKNEGVKFDFQSDWNFLLAMLTQDTGKGTAGKNIVKYLVENLGFEVDPHAHESKYTYADVAYLHQLLGLTPTGVVGGFLYLPIEDSKFDYLLEPIDGDQYPTASWQPTILWGAATANHGGNDEQVSGIWRPQSAENFFADDPNQLPYIGGYTRDADGVMTLIELAENNTLDPDVIHTATIFLDHNEMLKNSDVTALQVQIKKIKARDLSHLVQWVGLTEVIETWQSKYDSEPNIVYADGFEPTED